MRSDFRAYHHAGMVPLGGPVVMKLAESHRKSTASCHQVRVIQGIGGLSSVSLTKGHSVLLKL